MYELPIGGTDRLAVKGLTADGDAGGGAEGRSE
jgi:hypothetical protein